MFDLRKGAISVFALALGAGLLATTTAVAPSSHGMVLAQATEPPTPMASPSEAPPATALPAATEMPGGTPMPATTTMPAATAMPAPSSMPGGENATDMLHNNPNGPGWLDKFNRRPAPEHGTGMPMKKKMKGKPKTKPM